MLSIWWRGCRERIVWLGAEALRRLASSPLNEQQRFLLSDCVEAYLPVDAGEREKLERALQAENYAEVQTMNQTTFEKGIERGRRQERVELALSLLEDKFGALSPATRGHVEQLSMSELRGLALKIAAAASLVELGLSE